MKVTVNGAVFNVEVAANALPIYRSVVLLAQCEQETPGWRAAPYPGYPMRRYMALLSVAQAGKQRL